MSQEEWWSGLPLWLKLVFLMIALPAWLFMVFCILTGESKSPAALAAFGVFGAATLLFIIFDRRRGGAGHEGGGVEIGSSDSEILPL